MKLQSACGKKSSCGGAGGGILEKFSSGKFRHGRLLVHF
jgi:hypothetical protein